MDLSTADADKWLPLVERDSWQTSSERSTALDYEPRREIRQVHARLSPAQVEALIARYETGATVYELAAEFACNRRTVSQHLKRAGTSMRRQPPTTNQVDEMIRLYDSGLSMARVGEQVGFTAHSVLTYLRAEGVVTRDTHGQPR